jgi:hypothetical protein
MPRSIQYQQLARPVFVPAAPVVTLSWFVQWSEPRAVSQKLAQDTYAAPVFRPPDLSYGWFRAWSEPREANKRLVYDTFAEPTFRPPDLSMAWFAPWGEPVRFVRIHQDWIAAPTFAPVAVVPTPPLSWLLEWSSPLQPKRYGQDSYVKPVFAQPAPNYGWWEPWSEPIRFQRANQDYTAGPVPIPILPVSWFLQWSEPIRWQRANQDSYGAPIFVPPPAIVPSYAWFFEWDRPIFRRFPNQDNFWDYFPLTGLPNFVPPPSDPCAANPIPLPNGMDIFQDGTLGGHLIHIADGNPIIVRSDYALWCCACGTFVPKSEVAVNVIGFTETFKGRF